jgi:AraC-like DNA-binding protein
MDPRVKKIEELMQHNVQREWSLLELAQAVNLSVWRLSHIFVSEVGKSPMQYLRQLRMERAKYLLETSFLSVKEIAHQVGLNDESHFVRDFKKMHGDAPTRYRLRSRSGTMNSGNGKKTDDNKGPDEADNGNELPRSTSQESANTVLGSLLMFLNFLCYWASKVDVQT